MFSLTIAFGHGSWSFLFKDRDRAKRAESLAISAANPEGAGAEIEDDFGQSATFIPGVILGVLFEELNQTKDAQVERSLYGARAQADLNRRASSDAALKLASGGGMFGPNGMPHRMNG